MSVTNDYLTKYSEQEIEDAITFQKRFKVDRNLLWMDNRVVCSTATTNIYVNSSTGVDNWDAGYGASAAKPLKTLEYMLKFIPHTSRDANTTNGTAATGSVGAYAYNINIYITGTFTSPNGLKYLQFCDISQRIYIVITGNTTMTGYMLYFNNCSTAFIRLEANLTLNSGSKKNTTSIGTGTWMGMIYAYHSTLEIYANTPSGATAQALRVLTINGNTTLRDSIYLCGIISINCAQLRIDGDSGHNRGTRVTVNNCRRAFNSRGASLMYISWIYSGSGNTEGKRAESGSFLTYGTQTNLSNGSNYQSSGGRIFTGG